MTSRPLTLLAACAVLVLSGLVHGVWTERWHSSQALHNACARLAAVPQTAGAWKSTPVEVDPEPFEQTRAAAYWVRSFNKEGEDRPITVILMCGRADHMSLHTPDICYRGAGYAMVGDQVKVTVSPSRGGLSAELWTVRFREPNQNPTGGAKAGWIGPRELRIYWTWSADGGWKAPASPRWTFGAESFLYKLYVAHDNTGFAGRDSITVEFLEQLLPVLEKSLFAGM